MAFAYGLLPALVRWLPEYSIPYEAAIRINVPVLTFSVAIAIVTGLLSGVGAGIPVLTSSGGATDSSELEEVHRRSPRQAYLPDARGGADCSHILLLTSAGAAINGFLNLVRTDLGYDPHYTMSVGIPVHQNTHVSWEDRSHYFVQLLARVSAMPEVAAAGISTNATPPSNGNDVSFEIFGRPSEEREKVRANWVSPEYFSVLRIPLLQGRLWDQAETGRGAKAAVINQTWRGGIGRKATPSASRFVCPT